MRSSRWTGPALAVLAGCHPPVELTPPGGGGDRAALVDPSAWELGDAEDDPFDDRPATVDCSTGAWTVEVSPEPTLELDTGACDYFGLTQPTLVDVEAGDVYRLRLGHAELDSADGGVGHYALVVGDQTVWDSSEAIPCAAVSRDVDVVADAAVPAGTRVWLHLHNHGPNSWTLTELSAGSDARTLPEELGDCDSTGPEPWAAAGPVFAEHCTRCHASTLTGDARQGATPQVDFDTPEAAARDPWLTWTQVATARMPVDGPPVPFDHATTLWRWLSCGGTE